MKKSIFTFALFFMVMLGCLASEGNLLFLEAEKRAPTNPEAPQITINGISDGQIFNLSDFYNNQISATFTIEDEDDYSFTAELNGEPYEAGTPIRASRNHVLRVTAVDSFGNSCTEQISFTIDAYFPYLEIVSPQQEELIFGERPITIEFNMSEPGMVEFENLATGVTYRQDVLDSDESFTISDVLLANGENRFVARATDTAGNLAAWRYILHHERVAATVNLSTDYQVGETITAQVEITNYTDQHYADFYFYLEMRNIDLNIQQAFLGDQFDLEPGVTIQREFQVPTENWQSGNHRASLSIYSYDQAARDIQVSPFSVHQPNVPIQLDGIDGIQTTTEDFFRIQGSSVPGAVISLENDRILQTTRSQTTGDFTFEAVPVFDGENTYQLYATVGEMQSDLVTFQIHKSCSADEDQLSINQNVRVDFNQNPPTLQGPSFLSSFFGFENSGENPQEWRAIFDFRGHSVVVERGVTFEVLGVEDGQIHIAPGLTFTNMDQFRTMHGSHIRLVSSNADSGDLQIETQGSMTLGGTISNTVSGTWGLSGDIQLLSRCGDVVQHSTSLIDLDGSQVGGGDIEVIAEQGDITLRGLVHADFEYGRSPNIHIAAWNGSVSIDGDSLHPIDPWQSLPHVGGVYLRSESDVDPGEINIVAWQDITIEGYGQTPAESERGIQYNFDLGMETGLPLVPVQIELENIATDQVGVHLNIPVSAGRIRAVFGNSSQNSLELASPTPGVRTFTSPDGIDGVSDFWMQYQGSWDFGLRFDQELANNEVFVVLSAPGLTWQKLVDYQRNGWGFGVIIQPFEDDLGVLQRIVQPSPKFVPGLFDGTLAVKAEHAAGGAVRVRSLHGSVHLNGAAVDVSRVNERYSSSAREAEIEINAYHEVNLNQGQASLLETPVAVLNASASSSEEAGQILVHSHAGSLSLKGNELIQTNGGQDGAISLTYCQGIQNDGDSLPDAVEVVQRCTADTRGDSVIIGPPILIDLGENLIEIDLGLTSRAGTGLFILGSKPLGLSIEPSSGMIRWENPGVAIQSDTLSEIHVGALSQSGWYHYIYSLQVEPNQ